jgi:21S rRNA (uridine2791-2'-O)-methyltransferase
VQDPELGKIRNAAVGSGNKSKDGAQASDEAKPIKAKGFSEEEVDELERGYVDLERSTLSDNPVDQQISSANPTANDGVSAGKGGKKKVKALSAKQRDLQAGRVVDVVISDMSAPWDQTTGFRQNSISDPYRRMMNTSGNTFKDHTGSMVRNGPLI